MKYVICLLFSLSCVGCVASASKPSAKPITISVSTLSLECQAVVEEAVDFWKFAPPEYELTGGPYIEITESGMPLELDPSRKGTDGCLCDNGTRLVINQCDPLLVKHELGHLLGIHGHSEKKDALMHDVITNDNVDRWEWLLVDFTFQVNQGK